MSYRVTLSRPGAPPYLSVLALTTGAYPPGALAPLGGAVDVTRGGFCGAGSLDFSAPLPGCQPGDWVRVYLPDDAEDDPTYLGAVAGEPWREGRGTLSLAPLSEQAGKAAWRGPNSGTLRPFLLAAASRCRLAPGLSLGEIADDPATLEANPAFELLGDTFQAALPAVEGGTWGVDARGRIGLHAPAQEVTHRFVLGQAQTPPGTRSNYANCVRFPYRTPDGGEGWYEGRIEAEVDREGEVWEVAQAPASVATPSWNPLLGQSAQVTTRIQLGAASIDVQDTRPAFDLAWTGTLARPAGTIQAGAAFRPDDQAQSVMELRDVAHTFQVTGPGGVPSKGLVRHVIALRDLRDMVGDESYRSSYEISWTENHADGTKSEFGWQTLELYTPDNFNTSGLRDGTSSIKAYRLPSPADIERTPTTDYRLRLNAVSFNRPGKPQGIEITNAARLQDGGWVAGARLPAGSALIRAPIRIAGQLGHVERRWEFYSQDDDPAKPFYAGDITDLGTTLQAEILPAVAAVTVHLPAPLPLPSGSAVSVKAGPGASAQLGAGAVALQPLEAPDGKLRYGHRGAQLLVSALTFTGHVTTLGAVEIETGDTSILAGYALGLLRYRVQPVRVWTGRYPDLKRVPAHGVALFEQPGGLPDEALDVQRVTYDLATWTVTVEAGTPVARDSDDAIASAIESVRRENRTAGGGT